MVTKFPHSVLEILCSHDFGSRWPWPLNSKIMIFWSKLFVSSFDLSFTDASVVYMKSQWPWPLTSKIWISTSLSQSGRLCKVKKTTFKPPDELNVTKERGGSCAGYCSFGQARLKLQTHIDFKWKMKVVLAVKSSLSSCQWKEDPMKMTDDY